jgi:hypothetical protein
MSDRATIAAFDPAAPGGERADALSQLQQEHLPTASDLLPSENVRRIIDEAMLQFDESLMHKAINANVVPFPSRNLKLNRPGMKSVMLDDWQVNIQGDFWERPSGLSFDALRMMVSQTPILNAVIMTRSRQVQRFCRIAESSNEMPGFEIRHVDRDHQLTKSEKESRNRLNRFMMNCGWEFKPRLRKALRRDAFGQFMARSVRDSLTMDSAAVELEWKRDMLQGIDGFYAVDGATIRLCTEDGYQGDDELFALQLVQGQITTAYNHADLIYECRNPRADVTIGSYGLSETELLIRVVTGYINAMTYNIKGFDSNAIPKGMLHLTGNYDTKDLQAFKMYWNAMVKGINNAWSLPVMISKDQESKASFERFGVEFNEMYFSKWMTFLTSIICALYGMSPAEINFDSFSGGNSSPLSGSDTEEKLAASKDSGLRPLLSYYENTFSDFIIAEFSEDFVFRWTGLDPEDTDNKQEMRKLVLTVNEIRAEEGYQAMDGPLGDAPINPSLIQPWLQINLPQDADAEPGSPQPTPTDDAKNEAPPPAAPQFGDEGRKPDFGKAFGLPPVFAMDEM